MVAVAHLPAPPAGEVVVGDLTGDGLVEVIVPTCKGYYAYAVHTSLGFALYPVIVALLLAAIGVSRLMAAQPASDEPARPRRPPLGKKTLQWQQ